MTPITSVPFKRVCYCCGREFTPMPWSDNPNVCGECEDEETEDEDIQHSP